MAERLILALMAIWVARVTGECGGPPTLENGTPDDKFIPLTTFPVGTKVSYRCYRGYVFQEGGSRLVTCMAGSTWSPLQAVCEPRSCDNPGDILNGYYNASSTTLGSRVTFYCNAGYKMVGRDYRICTADGWDGQVPTCELVTCPDPPSISNGTVSSPSGEFWTFGSVAKYHCNKDYSLIGEDTITCGANGEWDKDPPRCQGECGRPPTLENGTPDDKFIPLTTFPVGTKVSYRCYRGYVFKEGGSRLVTCMAGSTWSPLQAVCEPRSCDNPGDILNGYYNASSTTLGSRVTFYCNAGYKMVGRDYRICTADGWDGQVPTCELVTCPDPPSISNGTVSSPSGEFWTFGSVAKYHCNKDYSLIGEDTITCGANGEWDKDPPRCQGECGRPPTLENGTPDDKFIPLTTFPVGTKVSYRCYRGYVFKEGGSRLVTCMAGSTWSPLQAVCEPRSCDNPGDILNGYYNASSTTLGSRVTFYCNAGYKMVGRDYRICTADGWDGQVPTCELVTCPDPPSISNGTVSSPSGEFWTFGSVAKYHCNKDYSLIGEDTITCGANGEWDKDPPRCQGECGRPPTLENGTPDDKFIPLTTFPVGTKVSYRCYRGYVFKEGGSRLVTCMAGSTWSPLQAVCEPRSCDNPGDILNGYYNASSTTLGSRVTFYCNAGYKMVGRDYRICTADGWDGQVPTCEPRSCDNPGDILNGYYNASSTTLGSRVTFYCNEGYIMVGMDYRICTADGWDGQIPKCEPRNADIISTTPSGGSVGRSIGQQFELLLVLGFIVFLMS
ncbi:sushi, von Willebrand factor type A, EGF and pentraxin domain-containing protein 1-like isoform X2 [Carcharodon carcharias]|uniref:sushi, von Willebrand factor type A, EGF and pentraxin domain-containing protein 1-like isoform X2 n=1 Tax=Carcharodon carcharias TaxID=13397 RepID=UPI001B7E27F8|nr:sushi, von Willebrand factor type A, EGF and pentraxin domain-containing protein 1-like isoform X2 [Carcharodon carcharias]